MIYGYYWNIYLSIQMIIVSHHCSSVSRAQSALENKFFVLKDRG